MKALLSRIRMWDMVLEEVSHLCEVNGKPFGAEDDSGLFGFSEQSHVGSTYGVVLPPPHEMQSEEGFLSTNGAVLPPPHEMQFEEGFLLRECKRYSRFMFYVRESVSFTQKCAGSKLGQPKLIDQEVCSSNIIGKEAFVWDTFTWKW
ncbi:hypothetical protein O6H91_09G086300 [Diphasiastrum complanatum]|nr:hypothetical protein O6H91_09G086300 [Diphasiastrum complanatum]